MPKSAVFFMKRHCCQNQPWGNGGSSHHRGQQMKAMCVPTAPHARVPSVAEGRWHGAALVAGFPKARTPLRKACSLLLPLPMSKKRAVFPVPWPQEHLHVLASSIFSILQSQMQLPISEIPYRSRMGVTSAASQGNLQGKHNFKAMFFSLILHILSSDSG